MALRFHVYVSPDEKVGPWLAELGGMGVVRVFGPDIDEKYHEMGKGADALFVVSRRMSFRVPDVRNVHVFTGRPEFDLPFTTHLVWRGYPDGKDVGRIVGLPEKPVLPEGDDLRKFVGRVMEAHPLATFRLMPAEPKTLKPDGYVTFSIANGTGEAWRPGEHFFRVTWRNAYGDAIEEAAQRRVPIEKKTSPGKLLSQRVPIPVIPVSAGNLRLRGQIVAKDGTPKSGVVEIPVRVMR